MLAGRTDRELIKSAGREVDTAALTAGSALHLPAGASLPDCLKDEVAVTSDSIPGYSIVREIHRGGQGVVYQAIQKTTRRKVAIKVMREGPFAGKHDKARFEREVHVLAALKHPNIVAIHESGTAAGSFYFVMDYVSGQPLDVYMAADRRSVRETLTLFQKICEAVNAAHLRGVIHRDLKPGNIRIDPEGQPQILDFGLAKVAPGQIGDESVAMTMTGQFIGSLPWASPEQAEGVPSKIDVRTDVYSLGVILYHMLTGKFPYDIVGSFHEVLDRVMKAAPVRPRTLRREIDDEVETIMLKCLSKDRERRYQSAGELGRDIRSYLNGEAIEAKRDSTWYVLRKNFRRYRAPVAVAAGFVLILMAGLIVSLTLWHRSSRALDDTLAARKLADARSDEATAARVRAESEAAKATAIKRFLQEMLSSANPEKALGREITVREVIDEAAGKVQAGSLKDQPAVEAAVRATLASAYESLGLHSEAEPHRRAVLSIYERTLGDKHPHTIQAMGALAWLMPDRRGESLCRKALELSRTNLGEEHHLTVRLMEELANTLPWGSEEKEAMLRRAIELHTRICPQGKDSRCPAMWGFKHDLAKCLAERGRLSEAEPLAREVLAVEPPSKTPSRSAWILVDILVEQKKFPEAEEICRALLPKQVAVLGESHPITLGNLHELVDVLAKQEKWKDAHALLQERRDRINRIKGPQHADTFMADCELANLLARQKKTAEAEERYRELIDIAVRVFGREHYCTNAAVDGLTAVYGQAGLDEKAFELRREYAPGREFSRLVEALRTRGSTADPKELAQFLVPMATQTDTPTLRFAVRALQHYRSKDYGRIVLASLDRLSLHQQLWMASRFADSAPDRLETLFPFCRGLDVEELIRSRHIGKDLERVGRLLLLAGDFEGGCRLLRRLAEDPEFKSVNVNTFVGWAELLNGRPVAARAAFELGIANAGKFDEQLRAARIAAWFLGRITAEDLVTTENPELPWWFIGERHLLAGNREQAVEAYWQCIGSQMDVLEAWPSNVARLRLRQLEGKVPGLPQPLPPDARLWEHPGSVPAAVATTVASGPAAKLPLAKAANLGPAGSVGSRRPAPDEKCILLFGHRGWIGGLAFAPAGDRLASTGGDATVRLWEVASGRELVALTGHRYSANEVLFLPDGHRLVSCSDDKTVKLWELPSGQVLLSRVEHTDYIAALAISPDGGRVASGDRQGIIRVWRFDARQEVATLKGHNNAVYSLAFSPDGARLASGSQDHTVRIWDLPAGELRGTWTRASAPDESAVRCVAFSPDGTLVAAASDDGVITLWDTASGQVAQSLFTGSAWACSCAFSPDGRALVSGGANGAVDLWNLSNGRRVRLRGHQGGVYSVAFSPDGRTIAAGGYDGVIRLWRPETRAATQPNE